MRDLFQPPQAMFTPDQLGKIPLVKGPFSKADFHEPPAFDFFGALLADQIRVCAAANSEPSQEAKP